MSIERMFNSPILLQKSVLVWLQRDRMTFSAKNTHVSSKNMKKNKKFKFKTKTKQ